MTIQQPGTLPNWADSGSLPAGTITTPSATERSNGFQQGAQAQVTDFVIALVANSTDYKATVNAVVDTTYTSDGSATLAEIITGLAAALTSALSGEPVTVSTTANAVRITANTPGQAFSYSTSTATYVTPTEVWANATNRPLRQYINWAFNLFAAWISFFFYAVFRWHDVGNDFDALAGGAPPATTSGTLVGTSGTATSYITDRRAVGLSEVHTYTATRDTYVDLNRDGSWTYVQGAHSFSPASPAANALRQYKVVTDGTQITSVIDLRVGETTTRQPWTFLGRLAATGAADDVASIEVTGQDPTGTLSLLQSFTTPNGLRMRVYSSGNTLLVAQGCYWARGVAGWFFDPRAIATAVMGVTAATLWSIDQYSNITAQTKSVSGADEFTTWTTWDAYGMNVSGTLSLGSTLLDTAAHARLPRLIAARPSTGVSNDMTLFSDGTTTGIHMSLATAGLSNQGPVLQITRNAVLGAGGIWTQGAAGRSTMLEIGGPTMRTYYIDTGSAATINPGDWINTSDFSGTVTFPTATVSGALTVGSIALATPVSRVRVVPLAVLQTPDLTTYSPFIYKVSGYGCWITIPIFPAPGEIWSGLTIDGNGWATGGDGGTFNLTRIDTLGNVISLVGGDQNLAVAAGAFHQAVSITAGGTVDPNSYGYMLHLFLGYHSVGHLYTARITYTKAGPT